MDPVKLIKRMSKTRIIIAGIVSAAVVIALFFVYLNTRNAGVAGGRVQTDEDGAAAEESDIKNMSQDEIEEGQITAARAAIPGKPVSGKVTERPDYVSRVEWEVFQNVVKTRPGDRDAQLTALVNKILFYKKKEAWEASGQNTEQRMQLGRELRDMLPYMKEGEHIHPDEARQLESALSK